MSKSECLKIFMDNPTKKFSIDELCKLIPMTSKGTIIQNCYSLFKECIIVRDYEWRNKKRGSRYKKTMVYQINLDYYYKYVDKVVVDNGSERNN